MFEKIGQSWMWVVYGVLDLSLDVFGPALIIVSLRARLNDMKCKTGFLHIL
jgi:hypothetical protein